MWKCYVALPLRGTETLKGRREGKERYASTIQLGVVRLGLLIDRLKKQLAYSSGLFYSCHLDTWHNEPFTFYLGALGVEKNNDNSVIFSFWVWSLQALLPSTETEITV